MSINGALFTEKKLVSMLMGTFYIAHFHFSTRFLKVELLNYRINPYSKIGLLHTTDLTHYCKNGIDEKTLLAASDLLEAQRRENENF